MKKMLFIAAVPLMLFSSFTPAKKTTIVSINKTGTALAKIPFSAKGSFTWEDVTGITCNGDEIDFPALTITYDYHGVDNGKIFMVQGTDRINGRGTSKTTAENYVADFAIRYVQKFTMENGSLVIHQKTNNSFRGDQGTVDSFSFTLHLTFTPNGDLVVEKSSIELVCQ